MTIFIVLENLYDMARTSVNWLSLSVHVGLLSQDFILSRSIGTILI